MNQVSLNDGYPVSRDFSAAIRKTNFVQDYCIDDYGYIDAEIVGSINRTFNEYLDEEDWKIRLRADAGSQAKAQLNRLHRKFEEFYAEWEKTCDNLYASRQVMDAYCGSPPPTIDNPEYSQCLQELSELRQINKLRHGIQTACQTFPSQLAGLPVFKPGRPDTPCLDRLIRQLSNIVSRVIREGRATRGESEEQSAEEIYENVSELLEVIDITINSKTLRNRNPLSRYYIPRPL